MQHAFEEDREGDVIAVLEQDTAGDRDVVWTADDWASFEAALYDDNWKLVRLSYRPHDFEPPGGMYAYLGAGWRRPLTRGRLFTHVFARFKGLTEGNTCFSSVVNDGKRDELRLNCGVKRRP